MRRPASLPGCLSWPRRSRLRPRRAASRLPTISIRRSATAGAANHRSAARARALSHLSGSLCSGLDHGEHRVGPPRAARSRGRSLRSRRCSRRSRSTCRRPQASHRPGPQPPNFRSSRSRSSARPRSLRAGAPAPRYAGAPLTRPIAPGEALQELELVWCIAGPTDNPQAGRRDGRGRGRTRQGAGRGACGDRAGRAPGAPAARGRDGGRRSGRKASRSTG